MSTALVVINKTSSPVKTYLTVGKTPKFIQSVVGIFGIKEENCNVDGSQGWLMLTDKTDPYISDKPFAGTITFQSPPLPKYNDEFPNGITQYEFCLNNVDTVVNAQETMDITCVNGVNCTIKVDIDKGTGIDFVTGRKAFAVSHIENGPLGTNTDKVGVYPCGCDTCISRTTPPWGPTDDHYENPSSDTICQIQRLATTDNCQGTITVNYIGKQVKTCWIKKMLKKLICK